MISLMETMSFVLCDVGEDVSMFFYRSDIKLYGLNLIEKNRWYSLYDVVVRSHASTVDL